VQQGREPILVAGDTIHAMFGFANNLVVHWSSVKTRDSWNTSNPADGEKWAFEVHGTRGILAYRSGPGFSWLESPFLACKDRLVKWKDLPEPDRWDWPEHARHPIKSLIRAVETDGSPVCSGLDGRWAVEMVAAVYESQRTKARVNFPLKDRTNPLLRF
jgi:predicted dehydrogenase